VDRGYGNEILSGMGNNRGFREQANGLKLADSPLCTEVATVTRGGVVKLGVGKYSVFLGLCQGTTSGERGVTRICPSDLRPGGENSVGTLPKFRKRETSEKGLLRNRGGENGVPIEGDGELPGLAVETSPSEAFPFLRTTSGSVSGVARGNCGWDHMCLPLKATINIEGSPQWSHHNGFARCIVEIFKGSDT
jgi:hypothetical protein